MKKAFSLIIILSMVLGLSAYQCSSTELTSARLYIQQKNFDKAKESLLKEVKKNPKSDEGYYLLGYVNGEQGNIEEMLKNYDKSLSISKKFEKQIKDSKLFYWSELFNKGVAYFNKGAKLKGTDSAKAMFDKAIKSFNDAINCEPDSVVSYKNLAYAYLNIDDTDSAIKTLEKENSISHSADSYVLLGELLMKKGTEFKNNFATSNNSQDSVKAMALFNKAVNLLEEGRKRYPANNKILLELSNAYIAANKIEIAREAFKTGVEKEPNNKYYRYNYGSLLLNAKDYANAVEQLTKAVEIDSTYENAIYNLGVAYLKWGAEIRDKATEESGNETAYLDKFKMALPYFEKYLQFHPNDPTIWDLLGRVYANLGMTEKSEAAFKKADEYSKN